MYFSQEDKKTIVTVRSIYGKTFPNGGAILTFSMMARVQESSYGRFEKSPASKNT